MDNCQVFHIQNIYIRSKETTCVTYKTIIQSFAFRDVRFPWTPFPKAPTSPLAS
jgi:hypothetical protein